MAIDLAYLPLVPRNEALFGISQTLELLAREIEEEFPRTSVTWLPVAGVNGRLVVNTKDALIKIEPNFVFRGALFPAETRTLCDVAQVEFEQFVESRILSVADLYTDLPLQRLNNLKPPISPDGGLAGALTSVKS